jgi:hypothetical protein
MDIEQWNREGRAKNERVCAAFEDIIERDGESDEDLGEDERSSELADAVLAEVVALNAAGKWREAHERFDAAHQPFIPHMEQTDQGLRAVVMLGPDAMLVRRGDSSDDGRVLHIEGDAVRTLDGVVGFAIARDRRCLALATAEGIVVSEGFQGPGAATIAWPDGEPIRPESFGISNDGKSIVIANDEDGVWHARGGTWTKLLPREGVGDGEDDEPDVINAAISPDGRFVAYGWQDAPGHYVEEIAGGGIERVGVVGTVSDYPYNVHFTDESRRLLSNTRHMQSGVTVCATVESLRGIEEYGDLPEGTPHTDEYLRAYGMIVLPGAFFNQDDGVAWIGGAGWSHAAPLGGGKPVFTQLLGSTLNAFDYEPVSRRVAVASGSGMLHVIEPARAAAPGRARGYRPRHELYRWIFWDTLDAPIRW